MKKNSILTVEYSPDGQRFGDTEVNLAALDYAKKVITDGSFSISTSTENLILALRLLIVKDVLPYKQVRFKYNGSYYYPNEYGVTENAPLSFCGHSQTIAENILVFAQKKRKRQSQSPE